jgi:hypothetical protein
MTPEEIAKIRAVIQADPGICWQDTALLRALDEMERLRDAMPKAEELREIGRVVGQHGTRLAQGRLNEMADRIEAALKEQA